MKKLLTILGSLGMVATAGVAAATVVSCGTKDSDTVKPVIDAATGKVTYTVKEQSLTLADGKTAKDVTDAIFKVSVKAGTADAKLNGEAKVTFTRDASVKDTDTTTKGKLVVEFTVDPTDAKQDLKVEVKTADETIVKGFDIKFDATIPAKAKTPVAPKATKVTKVEQADAVLTVTLDNAPEAEIKAENIKISTKADAATDLTKTNAITKVEGGTTATIKVTLTNKLDAGDYIMTVGTLPAFNFTIA